MANSNQTLKWINSLEDNKIIFDAGIIDGSKNRGIYGILPTYAQYSVPLIISIAKIP